MLAGAWNTRLFTPQWLAEHVFQQRELQVEFPDRAGLPYRYIAENVRITPSANQVVLSPLVLTDGALQEAERQAVRILRTLVHTPVSAFGTNFGFAEEAPTADALRLFSLGDSAELATAGYTIESTDIRRRLIYGDGDLNFTLSLVEGQVRTDFNFHQPVASSAEAARLLDGTVLRNRDRAVALLQDAYNFDITAEVVDL
ncbi:MAG TPA: hypothetical protein VF166_08770 [Gemmatimonadaceae bacterium]